MSIAEKRLFLHQALHTGPPRESHQHIIGGDFNFVTQGEGRMVNADFTEATHDAPIAQYWTAISEGFTEFYQDAYARARKENSNIILSRIDRIYTNLSADIIHDNDTLCRTIGMHNYKTDLSDHLPLEVQFIVSTDYRRKTIPTWVFKNDSYPKHLERLLAKYPGPKQSPLLSVDHIKTIIKIAANSVVEDQKRRNCTDPHVRVFWMMKFLRASRSDNLHSMLDACTALPELREHLLFDDAGGYIGRTDVEKIEGCVAAAICALIDDEIDTVGKGWEENCHY